MIKVSKTKNNANIIVTYEILKACTLRLKMKTAFTTLQHCIEFPTVSNISRRHFPKEDRQKPNKYVKKRLSIEPLGKFKLNHCEIFHVRMAITKRQVITNAGLHVE